DPRRLRCAERHRDRVRNPRHRISFVVLVEHAVRRLGRLRVHRHLQQSRSRHGFPGNGDHARSALRPLRESMKPIAIAVVSLSCLSIVHDTRADAPPGRYTAAGGVVTDTTTGLKWEQTVVNTYTYAGAATFCGSFASGGLNTGWRIPNA